MAKMLILHHSSLITTKKTLPANTRFATGGIVDSAEMPHFWAESLLEIFRTCSEPKHNCPCGT